MFFFSQIVKKKMAVYPMPLDEKLPFYLQQLYFLLDPSCVVPLPTCGHLLFLGKQFKKLR
jgi:hypothetical protein